MTPQNHCRPHLCHRSPDEESIRTPREGMQFTGSSLFKVARTWRSCIDIDSCGPRRRQRHCSLFHPTCFLAKRSMKSAISQSRRLVQRPLGISGRDLNGEVVQTHWQSSELTKCNMVSEAMTDMPIPLFTEPAPKCVLDSAEMKSNFSRPA